MFLVLTHVWCSHSWKLDIHLLCIILLQITQICFHVQSVIFIETIIQTWAGREEVLFETNVSWWDADHASDCTSVQLGCYPDTCTHVSLVTDTHCDSLILFLLSLERYSGRILHFMWAAYSIQITHNWGIKAVLFSCVFWSDCSCNVKMCSLSAGPH